MKNALATHLGNRKGLPLPSPNFYLLNSVFYILIPNFAVIIQLTQKHGI